MKMKKILSLLTAAAMTLSLGITSVSADTTEETGGGAETTYVAQIGDTKYETLQNAVDNAANDATIVLISDVNTTSYAAAIADKSLTIDLNGHNVTADGCAIQADGNHGATNVTIKGNGTVTAYDGVKNYAIAVWAVDGANMTIESGTYTQSIEDKTDDHFDLIYAAKNSKITINGGTFNSATPKWTLNLQDNSGSSIVVNNGTFVGYNPAESYTEPAPQPTSFVADGLSVSANKDGTYVVNPAASIGLSSSAVYYATLQDAVNATRDNAGSWELVYLQRDINTDKTAAYIKGKNKLKISLRGHNITASGYDGVFYIENSNVIIQNGTDSDSVITAKEDNKYAMGIWASTGAKVTLRDLTFKQEITSNPADNQYDMIYANKDAKVTVESGTFVSATPKWTLNKYDTDSATITVTGGKFYQYNPAESYTEPAQPTSFVKDGYSVTTDGDYFVVSQKPVAVNTATNVEYYSLDAAVKAVADGETATIKLLENTSAGASISDKKNITIDLNGKTISAFSGKDGVFVVNDATLTIEGEGKVVARQYMTAIAIDAGANATVNIKGGDFSQILTMPDDSNHYDFIYIEGANTTVNVSGGTFKAATPTWTLNIKDEFADTSKFNVTGGKFYNYNPAAAETEPTKPTSFVPGGYDAAQDSDGYYTVSPTAAPVAKIGETEYTTLQSAVKDAADDATITLIDDVNTKTYAAMIGGKTLTINLNGHNITSGDAAIYAYDNANVTIDGEGTVTAYNAGNDFAIAVWANNATININNGTYTQKLENVNPTEDIFTLIYSYGGGVININGGTFKPLTPKWTLNLQDNSGSTISVSDGTFYNYDPATADTEPGGTVSFVADGCASEFYEAEGCYWVVPRDEKFSKVAVMTHGNGKLTLFAGGHYFDYRNVGFIVDFGDGKTETIDTSVVYEEITDSTGKTIPASSDGINDFGASYIFGVDLILPAALNGNLESFEVTPFANVLNKSEQVIADTATKVVIGESAAADAE